jgi:hypothetical protein
LPGVTRQSIGNESPGESRSFRLGVPHSPIVPAKAGTQSHKRHAQQWARLFALDVLENER